MDPITNGDLNNIASERLRAEIKVDSTYRSVSHAISACQDETSVRKTYRPFLSDDAHSGQDWIARLELSTALKMVDLQIIKPNRDRLKVLVLYGSMRKR